jgi:hypothetical protein
MVMNPPLPTGEMPVTWGGKPAIWMAWTGDNDLPDVLALCVASIRRHNGADFKVIVVTPENLHECVDPHPAYRYLSLVHRADYLRLSLLHQYGGIYLDMDSIALGSMKDVYSQLSRYDLVTYDGATWGEVFGISVFGPTRRGSALTHAWDKAMKDLLDRRYDDLVEHRSRDPNPLSDCFGWNELLSALVQPLARQLDEEGQLSIRLLEPAWAHFASGGPAHDELFVDGSPQPPDTELLILNHALLPDSITRMRAPELLRSELGICRLLQYSLAWPLNAEMNSLDVSIAALLADALPNRRATEATIKRDVLVIVPTRARPESTVAFAEAFFANSTRADLLFALDEDDTVLADYPDIPGVQYEVNPRLRVVGTLNLLATKYLEQYTYLAFMGDDHRIRTPAWDQKLVEVIEELPTGIAYGNDLVHGANLPTAVLMDATIVRTLGYMVPPDLIHAYKDNVWRELGMALGSLRYRDDVVIEHLHPYIGKAADDAVYQESNNSAAMARDQAAYDRYRRSRLPLDVARLWSVATPGEGVQDRVTEPVNVD